MSTAFVLASLLRTAFAFSDPERVFAAGGACPNIFVVKLAACLSRKPDHQFIFRAYPCAAAFAEEHGFAVGYSALGTFAVYI